MKYIILSDIHANLQAFEAVVNSFPGGDDNRIICAGDVVGYGADPGECISMMRSLGIDNILGNHDAAAIEKTDISCFNEYAAEAVRWTMENLSRPDIDYLSSLPYVREEKIFAVAHGTLHYPEEFIYMLREIDVMRTFSVLKTRICFIGHTHAPCVFMMKGGALRQSFKENIKIESDARYIVNVGSVGQPRDRDNRACYCVYDPESNKLEYRRIKYDIKTARQRIISAGLPGILGDRLLEGR